MNGLWIVAAAIAGVAAGWWIARRRASAAAGELPVSDGPPLLEWVLRANAARGAWLEGPGSRQAVQAVTPLSPEVEETIRARLEHQRRGDGQGVERLESGTLVYAALDGRAAGLLLNSRSGSAARDAALRDLARLLNFDRWRPVLAELSKQQDTAGESVDSVAMRLAHRLERSLGVEVCIAVPTLGRVQIAGVSLRSDRRLLGTIVESDSSLASVATGHSGAVPGAASPLGTVTSDRRHVDKPAYLCPIQAESGTIAGLALWTSGGSSPSGADLAELYRSLQIAGPRLQAALERRALAEAALRDPLTGLLNRAGLQQTVGLIGTTGGVLIYLDLDHFKSVNDQLGHPAGDSALVHVARLLARAVRAQDAVARVGGEEFAIWLPGARLERGRQVAERVRQAIVWGGWQWNGESRSLTASFGVAAWPETCATREGLVAQADAALYEAKRSGRDRVVVAALSQAQVNL